MNQALDSDQLPGSCAVFSATAMVWSLTLPQVAATLAATLVAHDTLGAAGQRLLDDRMLNVVLVLVLVTAILGPVLTERFAPRLASGQAA